MNWGSILIILSGIQRYGILPCGNGAPDKLQWVLKIVFQGMKSDVFLYHEAIERSQGELLP
jgi:hypothetical protein